MQDFYKQSQTEIAKNQANTKQHPEAESQTFGNSSFTLSSKNDGAYRINHNESQDKMEKRPHRYGINRPKLRHEHNMLIKKCVYTSLLLIITLRFACG